MNRGLGMKYQEAVLFQMRNVSLHCFICIQVFSTVPGFKHWRCSIRTDVDDIIFFQVIIKEVPSLLNNQVNIWAVIKFFHTKTFKFRRLDCKFFNQWIYLNPCDICFSSTVIVELHHLLAAPRKHHKDILRFPFE